MEVLISMVITYLCVMLAVGYFTLMERKVLGGVQLRKGPNKVGVAGILQPIADGLKLLSKQYFYPARSNKLSFYLAPAMFFVLSLMLWHVSPMYFPATYFLYGVLFFLCVSSISVFGVLVAGWASNSKYAIMGAVRGAAQTISYEVSFSLLLLFCVFGQGGFCVGGGGKEMVWAVLGLPLFLMFLTTVLAETNRTPFDLVEGESELVSGYNVEYGGLGFTLIFIAEYSSMLFMSSMGSMMWLGGFSACFVAGPPVLVAKTLALCYFFVITRGALPRFRYDLLMGLTWKSFLPASLVGVVVMLALN
uniref:NADH-ubiquinone oxidoreductase chain 1 n=1 Tax=Lyonsia norwegica TaxID=228471 RepID=A0A1U9XPH4_LYONO|nr:NADH dehydrogenase subunit 1 [Lyonsia norwegica]AQZ26147.1 NADH dehydrogenase subunit 1 [Lyonsia norwegica]